LGISNGSRENMSTIGWSSSHRPAGQISARRETSLGASAAISAAIMPPIEWPTRIGFFSPSAATTSQPCRAKSSMSRMVSHSSVSP
jgi:hypothetical protein